MKKTKTNLNYTVRKLILIKEVQDIVRSLYESRQSRDEIEIYLRLVSNCVNGIIEKAAKNRNDFNLNPCNDLEDILFLRELEVLKVVSIKDICDKDEDGEYTRDGIGDYALVTIKDQRSIETLNVWVNDLTNILNYGIFSLNTITGEAYCLDNRYKFGTNAGMFEVFKAFLEKPDKRLSFNEIYKLCHTKAQSDEDGMNQQVIHQIIGDIRDKLSMKGKLSKLFFPSSNHYYLRPN